MYTTSRLVIPKSAAADTVKLGWYGRAYCATANVICVSFFGIVSVIPVGRVVYDQSIVPVSDGDAVWKTENVVGTYVGMTKGVAADRAGGVGVVSIKNVTDDSPPVRF